MLIRCEKCSTLYELDEKLLPSQGAPVQCSKCQFVFKAYPAPRRQTSTPDRAANDGPDEGPPLEPPAGEPQPPRSGSGEVVREGGMLAHSFDRAASRPSSTPSVHDVPDDALLPDADAFAAPPGRTSHQAPSGSDEPKFTADGRPIRKVPFPVGDSAQQGPRTPPFRGPSPKPSRTRAFPKQWVIIALAVVVVLALVAAWLASGRTDAPPASPAGAGAPAGQSRAAPQGGTPATPARN